MAKILVVDDDIEAAEQLALLFRNMGHATYAAFDGGQGLDAFIAFGADIVLLDTLMPTVDGYQAAQAMRDVESSRSAFLLAMTSAHGPHVEAATKAVGFDTYLCKPVDMVALLAIVAGVASRR